LANKLDDLIYPLSENYNLLDFQTDCFYIMGINW